MHPEAFFGTGPRRFLRQIKHRAIGPGPWNRRSGSTPSYGPHAITVKYLWNRRDAEYPDLGDRGQARGTAGIFYTLLGQERFGTVDWK